MLHGILAFYQADQRHSCARSVTTSREGHLTSSKPLQASHLSRASISTLDSPQSFIIFSSKSTPNHELQRDPLPNMRSDIQHRSSPHKHEPPESGWGYPHGLYYSGDVATTLCTLYPEQSGCENDFDGDPDGLHLPGRWCTYDGGFNVWKISAEEMKVRCYYLPGSDHILN